MRRLLLALAIFLVLPCEASLPLLIAAFQFEARTTGPAQPQILGMLLKVQVLDPPGNANLSPYLAVLVAVVKRNWYEVMPERALRGKQGEVKVRFKVSNDGTIVTSSPEIEWCSGSKSLDNAALHAVNSSTNLPPLPASVKAKQLDIRLIFLYNRDHEHWPSPGAPSFAPFAKGGS